MNYLSRRLHGIATIGVGMLMVSSVAQAATYRAKAVAVNGTDIAETNTVGAVPGDIIEVDWTLSGWGTDISTLQIMQFATDNAGMIDIETLGAAGCGSIRPLNHDTQDLRPTGAYISIGDRGICSGGTNDGEACVDSSLDCTAGICVGGTAQGQACSGAVDCPGGVCETGECIDGVCSGGRNRTNTCELPENQCDGGTCEPRSDYVFDGLSVLSAVDTFTAFPNYRYGGTLFVDTGPTDPSVCLGGTNASGPCDGAEDCPGGTCNIVEFYVGTALLEVQEGADGEFTYDLLENNSTFVIGPSQIEASLNVEPLTINVDGPVCVGRGACCLAVGDCQDEYVESQCTNEGGVFAGEDTTCTSQEGFCQCPTIVDSFPANCQNDARYPHPPDQLPSNINERLGLDSVVVTMAPATEVDVLTAADFHYRWAGGGVFNPPLPETLELLGGTDVRINFDKPFPQQRWSCVGLACQGAEDIQVCWGRLPADVDQSGVANATDVLQLIDGLNGVVALEDYQCDIDVTGVCNATDVLGVIDLLNGAGTFLEGGYNNVSQPVECPTAP